MEPPPSRYRVVERGGRLVVIDSVVGGAPPTARELLSGKVSERSSDAASFYPYPRESGDPGPEAVSPFVLDSRVRGNTAGNPPGAAQNVAETVIGNTRDDQGRLLLTTARWYDAKGPRTLALGAEGERQLGSIVVALAVGAMIAVVLAVVGETVGWVVVMVAIVALNRAKPIATAWLDRQARF